MNLEKITTLWKSAVLKLADYGLPVPMLRDPFTKKPSLPFTMVTLAIILVVIGIVGKLNSLVGNIDMGSAMQFLTTSSALYFGHTWVHNTTVDIKGNAKSSEIKTGKPVDE